MECNPFRYKAAPNYNNYLYQVKISSLLNTETIQFNKYEASFKTQKIKNLLLSFFVSLELLPTEDRKVKSIKVDAEQSNGFVSPLLVQSNSTGGIIVES